MSFTIQRKVVQISQQVKKTFISTAISLFLLVAMMFLAENNAPDFLGTLATFLGIWLAVVAMTTVIGFMCRINLISEDPVFDRQY